MARLDLYGQVHKGIRAALTNGAGTVGRTDFTRADEARACATALHTLFSILDEHAAHEEAVIMPEIARVNPELGVDLQADHAKVGGVQSEVVALLARLDGANAAERESLGLRVHERMWRLVAEQLLHLAKEEGPANRTLWAHFSDEQLGALQGRIIGSIPPPRMAQFLELMLPAMHIGERAGLLQTLHAVMPPEAFDATTSLARAALGQVAWSKALEVAGLAKPAVQRGIPIAN